MWLLYLKNQSIYQIEHPHIFFSVMTAPIFFLVELYSKVICEFLCIFIITLNNIIVNNPRVRNLVGNKFFDKSSPNPGAQIKLNYFLYWLTRCFILKLNTFIAFNWAMVAIFVPWGFNLPLLKLYLIHEDLISNYSFKYL